MHTVHCSGHLSCYARLPAMHAPPCHEYPLDMHASLRHMPQPLHACPHVCPLPCMLPMPHMPPPYHTCPPAMHAPLPCIACPPLPQMPSPPLPCMPPSRHMSPFTIHTPFPMHRILDTRLWKHCFTETTVADGNQSEVRTPPAGCMIHTRLSIFYQHLSFYCH